MSNLSSSELNKLNQLIGERIDEILNHFGIEYRQGNSYKMCCPIHNGDNPRGCTIYVGEHPTFTCNTHHCEYLFKKTLIGFIRGVLSVKKCGWQEGDKENIYGWLQTIDYIKKLLNIDGKSLFVKSEDVEKKDFVRLVNKICPSSPEPKAKFGFKIKRDKVRQSLLIPAEFYLKRGYSHEILDKYDIGLCVHQDRPMSNRVVVPIYDNEYKFAVECVGRSIFDECTKCKMHHDKEISCPNDYLHHYVKWKGTVGFNKNMLFNFWFARQHINKSHVVCVTESPGNVLRLEEAGIHNSVAIFGCDLSDGQSVLLEGTQALSVLILMDNDKAGKLAADQIQNKLKRIYNVHTYFPSAGDWGEMDKHKVKNELGPVIQEIEKQYVNLHN